MAAIGLLLLSIGGYVQFNGRPATDAIGESGDTRRAPALNRSDVPSARIGPTGTPSTGPEAAVLPARPGGPTRILIPALNVAAPIVSIGTVNGILVPPADPQKIGWWSAGAKPGAKQGAAIVTGHTVHQGGGAFDNLAQLPRGALITVATSSGQLRYRVSSQKTYLKRTLATEAQYLFDQRGPGRLVLVTCQDWDGTAFLKNVVVIAHRSR